MNLGLIELCNERVGPENDRWVMGLDRAKEPLGLVPLLHGLKNPCSKKPRPMLTRKPSQA